MHIKYIMNMKNLFRVRKTVTVAEIHEAFDSAQDELLQDAKNYLASVDEQKIEKSNRLTKLGFTNTNLVSDAKKQVLGKENSQEQSEIICYYKENYPFLKFLTDIKLEVICNRYGLIFAPVSHYLKDVPEKNLLELENNQQLKAEDKVKEVITIKVTKFWDGVSKNVKDFLSKPQLYRHELKYVPSHKVTEMGVENMLLNSGFSRSDWGQYIYFNATCETIDKTGLYICAPPSHFNLEGLENKGGVGFHTTFKKEIEDPIVFRYVRGGCQVLTKWGEEANDKDLIVDKLN